MTKTHNWVEWTAPSVSLSQTKVNDINLNDRPQMQNDTENEIGRSLFPFIHGLRILISFDYLHQSHAVKISLGCHLPVGRYLVFRDKGGSLCPINKLLSSESLYLCSM